MPKRTLRINSNEFILLYQTIKVLEHIYRDFAGYNMSNDEFKDLCRESWEEDYNYLCIDRSKKRVQVRYCICNESKNTYIDCTPEAKPF